MQPPPRPAPEHALLASQRRASHEVTEGIEQEIKALHVLSATHRVREICLFASLYVCGALTVAALGESRLMSIAGCVLMGVALNSLGILIHEGLHGLLASRPVVNHLLSFLCGLPLGISATAYHVTHNNHHYELGRKLDYGTYRQHLRRPALVWLAYFLQLFFGTILYVAFIPFLSFAAAPARSRIFIILEYLLIATVFVAVGTTASTEQLLSYWGFPLIVMTALTNVRGLGSHALGDVQNIYLSSRTITSSRLIGLLFLNENYHLEHHLFPGVPSYHLPKVHALVWNRLPEALHARSYTHFLCEFFAAAMKNDLRPLGATRPMN